MEIIFADSPELIEQVRELFREYEAGLGISLCFQNFAEEVATLPGAYTPPTGRLLLAKSDEHVLGCIAFRKVDDATCEMKRLYVRPEARGHKSGTRLIESLIKEARMAGYHRMRLDTLPGKMDTAIALYRSFKFKEIPPYYKTPVAGTLFMELDIA